MATKVERCEDCGEWKFIADDCEQQDWRPCQ